MLINKLIKDLKDYRLVGSTARKEILNLEYDSRNVTPQTLFCCIVGEKTDGHKYAAQAIENGAVALLVNRELEVSEDVVQIVVKDTRAAMAELAAEFYDHPSKKLTMIGVTGTNGKTTTTYMVDSIARQAGKKTGIIGTITNRILGKDIHTERTTPESVDLQKLLAEMVQAGVQWVVMEVSSHSLVLERVHGITFDVGIFTNLTQDHLDFHKDFEHYRQAKKKLFYNSLKAVINIDAEDGPYMAEGLSCPVYTYGMHENASYSASHEKLESNATSYLFSTPIGSTMININIPGKFSIYNSLAAASACMALGIDLQTVKTGLKSLEHVKGRAESIYNKEEGYTVMIDYAHTPDALINILSSVKEFVKGRLITLFGCGGDRDRTKRPIMGRAACKYSDFVIVTSDNPRTEVPSAIIDDIMPGVINEGCEYIVIENRLEAIKYALNMAKKDDIIVLAGKGHETYQEINGVKYDFDEKVIVERLLNINNS